MPDTLDLTSRIVAAHLAHNQVDHAQIPELIRSVHAALTNADQPPEEAKPKEPAVPVKRSVFNDHLVCLECGADFKVLKRHLQTDHNLTVDDYRQRFSLPRDYPIVAPDYAEMRSKLARQIGLGQGGRAARKARRKHA